MKFFTSLKKAWLIIAVVVCAGFVNNCFAQSKAETINAAYFFTFGRFATAAETAYWSKGNDSFASLVEKNRTYLKGAPAERSSTLYRAFMDSYGGTPAQTDINFFANQNKCYAEIVAYNMSAMNGNFGKRAIVITVSYQKVFGRSATNDEIKYWESQPLYSYVQLIAFHTAWKARNPSVPTNPAPPAGNQKPGILVKTVSSPGPLLAGTSSGVTTSQLAPSTISAIVAAGGGNIVAAGGGNAIAASAGNIVAAGGGNIVAAGGGN